MLDRHKKQIQAKAAMKKTVTLGNQDWSRRHELGHGARSFRATAPAAHGRVRASSARTLQDAKDRDAAASDDIKCAVGLGPGESKLAAGDPVRAEVAIEEFSNAAMAIGSQSHGEAARALTRLAGMNIPFEVLSARRLPKAREALAKSGGTREIRDAASLCVERWEKVARTSQEEGFRVWVRGGGRARTASARSRTRARARAVSQLFSCDVRVGLLRLPRSAHRPGGGLPRVTRGSGGGGDGR